MNERIRAITDKTLVPLSLVIVLLGGVAWLSSMHEVVASTQAEVALYRDELERIDRRLSHIEGKLGIEAKDDAH